MKNDIFCFPFSEKLVSIIFPRGVIRCFDHRCMSEKGCYFQSNQPILFALKSVCIPCPLIQFFENVLELLQEKCIFGRQISVYPPIRSVFCLLRLLHLQHRLPVKSRIPFVESIFVQKFLKLQLSFSLQHQVKNHFGNWCQYIAEYLCDQIKWLNFWADFGRYRLMKKGRAVISCSDLSVKLDKCQYGEWNGGQSIKQIDYFICTVTN